MYKYTKLYDYAKFSKVSYFQTIRIFAHKKPTDYEYTSAHIPHFAKSVWKFSPTCLVLLDTSQISRILRFPNKSLISIIVLLSVFCTYIFLNYYINLWESHIALFFEHFNENTMRQTRRIFYSTWHIWFVCKRFREAREFFFINKT